MSLLADSHAHPAHLHLHLEVRHAAISEFRFAGEVDPAVEVVLIEGPIVFERASRCWPQVILIEVGVGVMVLLFLGCEVGVFELLVLDDAEGVGLVEGVVLNAQHQ